MSRQSSFILVISLVVAVAFVFGVWFLDVNNRQDQQTFLNREARTLFNFATSINHPTQPLPSQSPEATTNNHGLTPPAGSGLFSPVNQTRSGVSFRQSSLYPLGQNNQPNAFEQSLIQQYNVSGFMEEFSGFVQIDGEGKYYYARPILVDEPCLSCHGSFLTGSRSSLAHSDQNEWVGWKVGQLMGVAVLTIPSIHMDEQSAERHLNVILLGGLFFLLIILAHFVLQKILDRRLRQSAQLMLAIAKEPSADKRLPVSGLDEVGQMESAFNQVVDGFQKAQVSLKNRLIQLVEEEDRFRSLAFSAVDGLISADSSKKIIFWNPGATEIFGFTEQEMVGESISRLIPERFLAAHEAGFDRVLRSGSKVLERKPIEGMGLHKSGYEIPIEISLSSWITRGDRRFSAIVRDTTERVRAKEKSHRELHARIALNSILEVGIRDYPMNEKLEKVLQVILAVPWLSLQYKGAIFLFDEKSNRLKMAVHHGLNSEIVSRCGSLRLGECLCGQSAQTKKTVFSSEVDDSHSIGYQGMVPHGHYCLPILLENRLLGVLNLYLDAEYKASKEDLRFLQTITHTLASVIDRKLAERKIRQLSQATEQSPASVIITNTRGMIEYVNNKCCLVTGYTKEELEGKNPKILKGGELPDSIYEDLWSTIMKGDVWRGELRNRKKSGELYWEDVAISPIRDQIGEITHFLAVKEDISHRKELEDALGSLLGTLDLRVAQRTEELNSKMAELELTRNELIESEKMASLGRLVAGFAHEINTPIGVAVAGSSQIEEAVNDLYVLLRQDEVEEGQVVLYMEMILEASRLTLNNLRRAGSLISSFKRTSVDQSSEEARLFNVLETMEDVVRALHNQLKKTSIAVQLICPENFQIFGAPGILDQVLTNLIMNSIIHGFKEGTLAGNITIQIENRQNQVDLIYSDSGVGMDEMVRQKIFEPFFSTHRSHGGSGLGLYLCYNLVTTKLNGTIACQSTEGKGVVFQISFPVGEKVL
ncbi:MAG: PAS domain S-box protein [Magnetococcales bacterium]|nr:PAS domain S-box protein [Magnetococcales bacterium]